MSLISKETLLTHLQRAEMASDVKLPIEFFRDLVYQAMPRTWVGLTDEDKHEIELRAGITEDDDGYIVSQVFKLTEAKLRSKNT